MLINCLPWLPSLPGGPRGPDSPGGPTITIAFLRHKTFNLSLP